MSRNVRASTRSRRGRYESSRPPRSDSHDSERKDPAGEESDNGGSPDSSRSSSEEPSTVPGDQSCSGPRSTQWEEGLRLRAETGAEQPSPDSWTLPCHLSPGSVESHPLASPSSAVRQQQGASYGRDVGKTYRRATDDLEPARRTKAPTAETTPRLQRLHLLRREIATAKSAETVADAVAARGEKAWD